jgi:hypothetical protein
MLKFLFTSFLMLVIAAPALAKSRDTYPVSCIDLWAAVKDSLENPLNYGILSMDDNKLKVSFIVVGDLTTYTDRIELTSKDYGCAMKATFLQVGSDDSGWRQFHHRLVRSLAKLQAAKPKPTVMPAG